jgi:hypothetical protein
MNSPPNKPAIKKIALKKGIPYLVYNIFNLLSSIAQIVVASVIFYIIFFNPVAHKNHPITNNLCLEINSQLLTNIRATLRYSVGIILINMFLILILKLIFKVNDDEYTNKTTLALLLGQLISLGLLSAFFIPDVFWTGYFNPSDLSGVAYGPDIPDIPAHQGPLLTKEIPAVGTTPAVPATYGPDIPDTPAHYTTDSDNLNYKCFVPSTSTSPLGWVGVYAIIWGVLNVLTAVSSLKALFIKHYGIFAETLTTKLDKVNIDNLKEKITE